MIKNLIIGSKREKENIDLYRDHAVFHFFQTKKEQKSNFDLVGAVLKPNAYIIISVFKLQSATKCSDLPVFRQDENILQLKLGYELKKTEVFNYSFTILSGSSREYVYALFGRNA